jgi:hypothetical protein
MMKMRIVSAVYVAMWGILLLLCVVGLGASLWGQEPPAVEDEAPALVEPPAISLDDKSYMYEKLYFIKKQQDQAKLFRMQAQALISDNEQVQTFLIQAKRLEREAAAAAETLQKWQDEKAQDTGCQLTDQGVWQCPKGVERRETLEAEPKPETEDES